MTASVDTTALHEVDTQLRIDSILASTSASSGHLTSSMSAADLTVVVLLTREPLNTP